MKLLVVKEDTKLNEIENVDSMIIKNNHPDLKEFVACANEKKIPVYLWIVEFKYNNLDLNTVKCIFVNTQNARKIKKDLIDEHRILDYFLKKYNNLRVVLMSGSKGCYFKDKDLMVYQKSLGNDFDEELFIKKYLEYELKGYTEMTSLYKACA
jgi:hypothetical protein